PPADELGVNVGGVGNQPHGGGPMRLDRIADHGERRIEIGGDVLEVADLPAPRGARRIDLDAKDRGARHAAGERLAAAHAAEAGRQDEAAGKTAAEALLGNAHEDFVGALDDALAADILPGARREPAPGDE